MASLAVVAVGVLAVGPVAAGILLTEGSAEADPDVPAGRAVTEDQPDATTRVAGPAGLSYRLPAEGWRVREDRLTYTTAGGRRLLTLGHPATFDEGYCAGEGFSARAIVGFARGLTHRSVVARMARGVGAPRPPRAVRRIRLAGGHPARASTLRLRPASGRCRPQLVVVDVVSIADPRGPGGRGGRDGVVSWVLARDVARASVDAATAASIRQTLRRRT